jgi:choline kinase
MKAVVLAAGMGIRLMPMTQETPKALIHMGDKTLLQWSFDALCQNGITDAVIVIGHLGHLIQQTMKQSYNGIGIQYVSNDNYAETGSMGSLYQAREILDDDILLLESDLLYEPRALSLIIETPYPNAILVGKMLDSGDDVYICVNDRLEITGLGKQLSAEDRGKACGALVGISKLSRQMLDTVFVSMEEGHKQRALGCHYEDYIFEVSKSEALLHGVICPDLNWIEIDTPDDLRRAREEVYPLLFRKE